MGHTLCIRDLHPAAGFGSLQLAARLPLSPEQVRHRRPLRGIRRAVGRLPLRQGL